ncbi:hypothetical protein Tco_0742409, partial [Tanacetum coccineum]
WLSLIPILNSLRSFKQPYKPCSLRFANRFTKNSGMVLDRLMVQARILHQSLSILAIAQFPDVAHNLEILQDQEDCDESERSGKKDSGECRHAARNCFKYGQTGHLQQDDKKDTATKELPGISSIRDVEYDIEFASGTKPIAEAPYRISPVKCFLELADHYHRVFEGFSRLALPLTKLTRKDEKLYGSESKRRSLKNEIVQLHGTPSAIVSDKDPRFTFRILETHARQEGYTNKLSRPLKFTAKLSCFLESIAYEWRQTFWYHGQVLFHQAIRNSRSRREISYCLTLSPQLSHVHDVFHVFCSEVTSIIPSTLSLIHTIRFVRTYLTLMNQNLF